jgi:lactate dehydrogenase-like 2-hydroxyacid dehydrogenase
MGLSVTCDRSPGITVSSINKTDCHDIAEILMKVALKTNKKIKNQTNRTIVKKKASG